MTNDMSPMSLWNFVCITFLFPALEYVRKITSTCRIENILATTGDLDPWKVCITRSSGLILHMGLAVASLIA